MPGYDTTRFPQPPANEFVCLICYDVLCNPVIVPECEHVFCADCLHNWVNHRTKSLNEDETNETNPDTQCGRCPVDQNVVKLDELQPPQRLFRNLLLSLSIRCVFEPACDLSVPICELDYHETNCVHNPENASREIECPKNCGAQIRLMSVSKHDCVEYLKRLNKTITTNYEEAAQRVKDLTAEKIALIETIQSDSNKYESTIQSLKTSLDKLKRSHERELQALRSNYSQIGRKLGTGSSSVHLVSLSGPNTTKSKTATSQQSVQSNSDNSKATTPLPQIFHRQSSWDATANECDTNNHNNASSFFDEFALEPLPVDLPTPLTPSRFDGKSSNLLSSRTYSESIPNLVTFGSETSSTDLETPTTSATHTPTNVVRNAIKVLNKLPTMIPYMNPPAVMPNGAPGASATRNPLQTMNMKELISRMCYNEKVVQVMSLVDRRHFYPSNEYYKCANIKHGSHSFKLAHELKLLELIEPLINGDSRVLDIGSGVGFLTVCLAQIAKSVLGVEHVKDNVARAREIVQKNYAHLELTNRIDFVRGDGRFKCWNQRFDLIIVEAIVKHTLPEIYVRSLRPRGSIIVPMKMRSKLQLCRVRLNSEDQIVNEVLIDNHDYLAEQYRDTLCDIRNQEKSLLDRFRHLQ